MALTVTSRGTGTHNTGATTLVPGGRTGTLAVGSLGVLAIALDNAGSAGSVLIAPDTWTDAKANVWTLRENRLYDNGAASAGIEMAFYTAPITVALLTTDAGTMTWKTGVSPVAKAWTWYEVIPSNGITPVFLGHGDIAGATAANATVATVENINVGDAIIGGYFSENVAAVTGDADSTNGTWTAQQTATVGTTTSGVRVATQQKVQTTAASTQSYDVTVSSQDRIAGYISVREVQNKAPAPTAASLVASGSTPTVTTTNNVLVAPTAAALTATGATPTVTTTANVLAVPTAASLTATGSTPTVSTPVLVAPSAVALALTPATPTVVAVQVYAPDAAALVATGATPAVLTPVVTVPGSVGLALAGATPAVATPVVTVPDAASLSLSTDTPEVRTPVVAQPSAAALALAFGVPDVLAPRLVEPDSLGLVLTGATPTVTVAAPDAHPVLVSPGGATLHLTGRLASVSVSGGDDFGMFAALRQFPPIIRPDPVDVRPSQARIRLAGAVPVVTIIDDGDFLSLLTYA